MSINPVSHKMVPPAVSCVGKVAFDGQKRAQDVANRPNRAECKRSAYHCAHCNKWHIGSDRYGLHRRRNAQSKKGRPADE